MGFFDKLGDNIEDTLGGAGRYVEQRTRRARRNLAPVGRGAARVGLTELGRYETLIPTPQKLAGRKLPGWMTKDFVTIDPRNPSVKFGWRSDPDDVARFKEEWKKHPVSSGLTVASLAMPLARPLTAGARGARVAQGIERGDKASMIWGSYNALRPPPLSVAARRKREQRRP